MRVSPARYERPPPRPFCLPEKLVQANYYFDACELTDLMGVKAIEMLAAKK